MIMSRSRSRWTAGCAPFGVAAALGTVALMASACSSSPSSSSTTTTIASTSTSTTAATGGSTTTTAKAAPTPAVENLVATSQVKSELMAAFVAMKQVPAADAVGTTPGSVYYAYDTTTKTYWAFASFELSPSASYQVQVGWQDGGGMGLFSMAAGSPWSVQQGGVPPYCSQVKFYPAAVLAVWNISEPTGMNC